MSFKVNPLLCTDGYKVSHHLMYPEKTEFVYSNFTPRSTKYMPKQAQEIVVFGIQYTVKYINDLFKDNFFNVDKNTICGQLQKHLNNYLGSHYDISHFEKLYDLGYLPIEIKSLEEGSIIKPKIPILTINNTLPEFYWVTNFLETLISTTLWKPLHSASMVYAYHKIGKKYLLETDKDCIGGLQFQFHDFSMRGMQSLESAISSALGFMVASKGTDTLPVLQAAEYYYGEPSVGHSVPACFPDGAEVLTNKGFKLFEDLDEDDLVAQYNEDGTINFVLPIKYHEYDYDGELINFKIDSDLKYVDFTVTPNHRVVGITSRKNILIKEAIEFNYHSDLKPIVSGKLIENDTKFTDFDRLLIAFQADGSYSARKEQYTGDNTGTIPIRFSLKKDRKADRLRKIIKNLDFEYSESKYENGYYSFRIKIPFTKEISKTFDWIDLSKINGKWAEQFIEELQFWDGNTPKKNIIGYSSTEKFNVDMIMSICSLCNHKTHYRKYTDKRGDRKSNYCLTICKKTTEVNGTKVKKSEVYYNGKVRCVTVPSGMIIIRQNERIIISGNSEHAVMTAYGKENEINSFSRILDLYPNGIVSMVSDQFDLWKVLTEYLPELKDKIMARDGKAVFRPDSGNPADILCGTAFEEYKTLEEAENMFSDELYENQIHGEAQFEISEYKKIKIGSEYYELKADVDWNRYDKQYYFIEVIKFKNKKIDMLPENYGVVEILWNVFGGTINEQGYKVLDSHVSTIYGDSITLDRAEEICERLKNKGFASTNVVFGAGSFSMGMASRDSQGSAVKATYVIVDGVGREIYKDPVTDDGTKKSAKGLLAVFKDNEGEFYLKDQATWDEVNNCEFKTVFKNGMLFNETTYAEIRKRLGTI